MPPLRPAFAPAFGCVCHHQRHSASTCGPRLQRRHLRAQRSSLRVGCVVPPLIAWRPHPPVWATPLHFPAVPVIDAIFDIQGPSCLPPTPSGLSLLHCPVLPPSASAGNSDACASVLPHRHWPSGRRWKPLAVPTVRSNQLHAARDFDVWFVRFRYGPAGCSPPGLTRPERLCVPSASEAFTSGLSGHRVTPSPCRISLRRQTENCAGGTFTRKCSS